MKLKQLEILIGNIEDFDDPNVQLEQYGTGAHIGSRMLYTMANTYDDIEGKSIVDLGVGCGRLGLAAACLGADFVIGIDIDRTALDQCARNLESIRDNDGEDLLCFEMLQGDICDDKTWTRFHDLFDVALMNPPFGTKNNSGTDMIFLKRALELSKGPVYSLHKTSTRKYVLRKAEQEFKVKGEVLAELRYDLPRTYRFHKKQSKDIEVDFIRFEPK